MNKLSLNRAHGFCRRALAIAIASATTGWSSTSGAEAPVLDEVIVTATAREQNIQDIPYNISALSGEDLKKLAINGDLELLRTFSGATMVDRGARNAGIVNSIVIRGLNVGGGNEGDNPLNAVATVSTYVDNTPMYSGFVVRDMQRVELLRGPQGTLYGSGALGGTLRRVTNKPDTEAFAADMALDYGSTENSDGSNRTYDALLNIPLSDTLAVRGHVGRIDNDGVVDYINAYQLNSRGEPLIDDRAGNCVDPRSTSDDLVLHGDPCFEAKDDSDTVKIDYARLAMRWQASDTLSATAVYQTQEDDIGARRAITLGDNNQRNPDPTQRNPREDLYFAYDDDDNGSVLLEDSERDVDLYSLDIEWDLGFAMLTSSTAQFEDNGVGYRDNGGLWTGQPTDFNFAEYLYYGWPRQMQRTESGYTNETFVQELRLVSAAGDSRLDWLGGVFWLEEDKQAFNNSYNPGINLFHEACLRSGDPLDPLNPVDPACQEFWPVVGFFGPPLGPVTGPYGSSISENDYEYKRNSDYEEVALYGELTYHITDDWHLTGGLRWFANDQTTGGIAGFPTSSYGAPSTVVEDFDDDDQDVLFKLNLSYDYSEATMLYGTISEGYRRSGVNQVLTVSESPFFGERGAENIKTFDKDSVVNYELGLKTGTDRHSISAALFYMDWSDPQVNVASVPNGFLYASNGDKAHTAGIEFEANGFITDWLRYRLGYGYVEAELDDDVINRQTGGLVAPDGARLPATPENVLSFGLDAEWQLASGIRMGGQLTGYYNDEQENILNPASGYAQTLDDFLLLDASLSLYAGNWRITAYGENLGDEEATTSMVPQTQYTFDTSRLTNWYGNANHVYIGQPRTFGLRVGYAF